MNRFSKLALLLLSLPSLALGQTPTQGKTQTVDKDTNHGYVDFGVRFATGDVYGRPDLPFDPVLKTSKFNEYRDIRNGFFVRRADVRFDNILHTKNYFSFQSSKAIYRDKSYLDSFGQYDKIMVQNR